MWRSSKLASALALFVGLVIAMPGCGDGCIVSCEGWEEADVTRLHSTYLGPADGDGRLLLFDTAERGVLEIEVFGNTDALDRGTDYVIPYVGPADLGTVQASLPRDCGCGPTMTHADGSAIQTGVWQVTFEWWPSWRMIIFGMSALSLPVFAFAYFTRDRSPDFG